MGWFEVDKGGLRQLLEGKDKGFVLRELIQNAWDEPGVTRVNVILKRIAGTPFVEVEVEDDAPEGFYDLRHAFTLFANTRKRKDAEARGRFNLGEKQVLALCRSASIITTKGTVIFTEAGERKGSKAATESGSVFTGEFRMTTAEIHDAMKSVATFLSPKGIVTTFNEALIEYREPKAEVEAVLATEVADDEGILRPTKRKTVIEIHEVREGETAMIYEMGLPVVETGDRYHYNITQRVPLTADRDNVKPSFLRDVRAEVLNIVIDDLDKDEASEQWVREAGEDERTTPEVFRQVMTKRFGNKRVVADPSDPQSKERAIAGGYHIVAPGSLSRDEWAKAREADAIPSSSKLFPTRFAEAEVIEATPLMERVAELTRRIAKVGLGIEVDVHFINSKASSAAQYGGKTVTFNVSRLGRRWFRETNRESQRRLIIHEVGHEHGTGHLDERYYEALALIGARLAVADPSTFEV
jgi:hypothetical protein